MNENPAAFWSVSAAKLLQQLQTTPQGLTSDEARQRLERYGGNLLKPKKRSDVQTLLLAQFKSPIILILIVAAILSIFLHDPTDAIIILVIVFVSGLLGFWQEHGATNAVEKLLAVVQIKTTARRDGRQIEIPLEAIAPGDIVMLSAGAGVPADGLILESKDLFVDEAALTGETYPVEKTAGVLPAETALSQRTNMLFMGTHVVSGSATGVVVHTGAETEFGKVSERLKLRPPETEFERGIRRFGYFLMEVTLLLVIVIFAINVHLHRHVLDSFLFALALAVGLTPQLLPAIISINLSHGAKRMAGVKVIVKRLAAIENFGSMNVLCSDKTGTLTEGVVKLHSALGVDGKESEKALHYAYLNAYYETGFINPIDEAIRTHRQFDVGGYQKLDEVPYDFIRKRLSILLAKDNNNFMVTKGALQNVLAACTAAETSGSKIVDIAMVREKIQQRFAEVEPNQKERIIRALQKAGNVVGYMGDGINDASALHAADVGLSVDSAVDVAKAAADIVLLEKDLRVLVEGVREGRMTFANTLKYVFMATSANFGNMFSMAGASLFLPFLPLLPKQILLGNLMTDFPEMGIATDSVDSEMVEQPRRWNIDFIRNFMLALGPLSSVFDFLTFGVLMLILHATPEQFRTGWFVESLVSAPLIVLVIRTRRPFFKSRPGRHLLWATWLVVAVTLIFPFTPLGKLFGFAPLSMVFMLLTGVIIVAYIIAAEIAKKFFYKTTRF